MGRPPRARRLDGHRTCLRLLELVYDHLNELIGRLDLPAPDRIGLYKLRAIVERQLIAEGVLS